MEKVFTEKAPAAIGPYSQAMKTGNLLYTSGQIPIDPATGNVEAADITGQTEQVMQNLKAVLEAAGYEFDWLHCKTQEEVIENCKEAVRFALGIEHCNDSDCIY